jgi:hypothetical protein
MIVTKLGKGAKVAAIIGARAHALDTIGREMGTLREPHRLSTDTNPLTETDAEFRCRLIASLLGVESAPPYSHKDA